MMVFQDHDPTEGFYS